MPGKLCKTVRKLAWQIGKTTKQTHQDKFHRNFKDKVLAWKASECCGNLFNVASVHSTHNSTHKHTHKHTFSHNKTNTHKRPAKCLKSHRQSQWPTQQNERRKNEFFWPGQNRYKIRVQFSTDEGGEKKGEREGDRLLNLCGISCHFKRSTDIDIESMPWHSLCLPRIRGVYVMRECVRMCGDINKSIYAANNCICL